MQVVWPAWVCQVCRARLVPADLHPRPNDCPVGRPAPDETDIVIEMSEDEIVIPAEQPRQPERETSG